MSPYKAVEITEAGLLEANAKPTVLKHWRQNSLHMKRTLHSDIMQTNAECSAV